MNDGLALPPALAELVAEPAPDPKRWLALVVLLTGAFLTTFDFFVVNVALPSLHTDLGARPAEQQLVVAGYGLAFAVLLVTGGRLGDLYGRKRVFIIGIAGFTIASALCGLALSPQMLIASRVLQGLTAAIMGPQVLAIIRVTFPESERARAIGFFGTTAGLASIVAQLLGGALVEADIAGLSWRPIFLINVPVGIAAILGARTLLRDSRADGRPTLDLGGIALGSAALLLLVYPAVEGREQGWPLWSILSLAASGPMLAAFVFYEWAIQNTGRSPLVSLRLFRDRTFSLGLLMALTFFGGLSGFFIGLTVFLQQGFAYSPLVSGMVFAGFGSGFMASSLVSARLSRRIGALAITCGTAIMASGLLVVIAMTVLAGSSGLSLWALGLVLVWFGVGQGITLPTLMAVTLSSRKIPPSEAGAASGVFTMVQQVAFALGVAVIIGVFFSQLGAGTDPASYERALTVALSCTVGMLALTGTLALFMPRAAPVPGIVAHLD